MASVRTSLARSEMAGHGLNWLRHLAPALPGSQNDHESECRRLAILMLTGGTLSSRQCQLGLRCRPQWLNLLLLSSFGMCHVLMYVATVSRAGWC